MLLYKTLLYKANKHLVSPEQVTYEDYREKVAYIKINLSYSKVIF